MTAKQPVIDVFFNDFEAPASHISFTDSLNLLKAVLFTYRIKSVVDTIKEFNQLSSGISLDDLIEVINVNEDDSDLTLRIGEVLFSILDARSHDAWNQNVYDRFELLKFFHMAELRHKVNFLLYLVPVCVVSPKKYVKGNGKCLPNKLDLAILHRLICHVYELLIRVVVLLARNLLDC